MAERVRNRAGEYQRSHTRGILLREAGVTVEDERRFWAKVDRGGECWIWRGAIVPFGYGAFRLFGVRWYAHRASWFIARGPIPEGLAVCHRCDNPPCVNPAHLFLGTIADNQHDMARKGRASRGTGRYNAKLTEREVRAIRASAAPGKELALRYLISPALVSYIRRGLRWRHVVVEPATREARFYQRRA